MIFLKKFLLITASIALLVINNAKTMTKRLSPQVEMNQCCTKVKQLLRQVAITYMHVHQTCTTLIGQNPQHFFYAHELAEQMYCQKVEQFEEIVQLITCAKNNAFLLKNKQQEQAELKKISDLLQEVDILTRALKVLRESDFKVWCELNLKL